MIVSGNTSVRKKTLEMTAHNDCGGIGQLRPIPTKTTDRLQSRQFDLKKVFTVDTPAKASGQLNKIQVTKPQLVYCGVGIADQPGTGPVDQWERSVWETRREANQILELETSRARIFEPAQRKL